MSVKKDITIDLRVPMFCILSHIVRCFATALLCVKWNCFTKERSCECKPFPIVPFQIRTVIFFFLWYKYSINPEGNCGCKQAHVCLCFSIYSPHALALLPVFQSRHVQERFLLVVTFWNVLVSENTKQNKTFNLILTLHLPQLHVYVFNCHIEQVQQEDAYF